MSVQTSLPIDPPRVRKVSVWVHVDEIGMPAHVEAEIINDITGVHRARLAGQWGGCVRMQAVGYSSIARLVARLTERAVWYAALEVDGTRHVLPRDVGDRWARLVELQALALGLGAV